MGLQQTFLEELLLDLLDLDCPHLAAVRSEFAVGLSAQSDERSFGLGGEQGGEEFLFEHGEGAVDVLQVGSCRLQVVSWRHRVAASERRRAAVSVAAVVAGDASFATAESSGRGVAAEVAGNAVELESRLARLGGGGRGADGGFAGLRNGLEDGLGAPGETVDLALAAGSGAEALRVVLVEGVVDAAEDGFEGDSRFRQVSISAQSRVESMRMEPRRCWKRVSISVK